MKFYAHPNELVKKRVRQKFTGEIIYKPLLRFDENGEYETDDPVLIEKMKRRFKHEDEKDAHIKCKKCGAEFENIGLLMHHHKKEHPKGGE